MGCAPLGLARVGRGAFQLGKIWLGTGLLGVGARLGCTSSKNTNTLSFKIELKLLHAGGAVAKHISWTALAMPCHFAGRHVVYVHSPKQLLVRAEVCRVGAQHFDYGRQVNPLANP